MGIILKENSVVSISMKRSIKKNPRFVAEDERLQSKVVHSFYSRHHCRWWLAIICRICIERHDVECSANRLKMVLVHPEFWSRRHLDCGHRTNGVVHTCRSIEWLPLLVVWLYCSQTIVCACRHLSIHLWKFR